MFLSIDKPKLDNLANEIWKSAERLRGKFKAYEYQNVVLPIIVIRRLECVLLKWREDKKEELLANQPKRSEQQIDVLVKKLEQNPQQSAFSNKTDWTLRKVFEEDHTLIEENFRAYINGFSKNVDDIIENFNYRAIIRQMVKNNRLAPILNQYKELDLGPDRLSNLEMGYVYEELLRRFSEQSGEEAGEHFTPREVIRLMVELLEIPIPKKHLSIYDPVCGTGGMLSVAKEHLLDRAATPKTKARVDQFVTRPIQSCYRPEFFCWVLISDIFPEFISSSMVGTTINHLYQKTFERFIYPLPSKPEQERIVVYLDASCAAIDAAMAAKRHQLEILENLAQRIMHKAVTQGLRPDVSMKPSGMDWLSEVPAHWKVKQIKRACEIVRGKFTHRPRNDPAFYGGEYPFVQTGNITAAHKYIRSYSQTLNELGLAVSKVFPRGTLVMSIAANIGDVAILDFEACFPDSMVGLIPGLHTDLNFFYYLMRAMKSIMLRSAVISTHLNLNYVRIGTNFAAFPPKKEQEEIAAFLDAKEQELHSLKTTIDDQITTLLAYRKSLIHECVTGQRRVTEAYVARVRGGKFVTAEPSQ